MIWVLSVCLASALCAQWNKTANQVMNALSLRANVTTGGVYQDQCAGLFTGGSVSVRAQSVHKNLAHFEPPSVEMGCSGIDLFTGGMSFVRAPELVQAMKSIAGNAASYAFGLALQTVTPQLKSVLDIVHAQMMRINSLSIQSCEKAAALVGGMWPKTDASKQIYCSTKGLGIGRFDDWAHARQGCATSAGQASVAQQPDKRFEHIVSHKMNVVWDALKASGLFNDDPMWKEVFLSITGTIVRDAQGKTLHFPSLCQSQDWIRRFMRGGSLPVYRCSDDRCLTLNKQTVDIEESLYSKLYAVCSSIEAKIKQGVALDDNEKSIVHHSRVPVLKFMTINAFAYDEVMPHHEIVEVLAFDLVMRWVEEVLTLVEDSVQHIRSV